jgi:hypothetical protein
VFAIGTGSPPARFRPSISDESGLSHDLLR